MWAEKRSRVARAGIALVAATLLAAGCSLSPFRFFTGIATTPRPAIVLSRCDEVRDVLCLATFGVEPPDQMVIVLLASPGLPEKLEARVTFRGSMSTYPCTFAYGSPAVVSCTGPQAPLGSSLRIQIFVADKQVLLADGEFTLTALVMPTMPENGVEVPTPSPLMTGRPTRTPILGTAYPNPNR
jgi:hypothetical protein